MSHARITSPSSLGDGVAVGHWTHKAGGTGCTVILPPAGNVCAYEVRGSAPGSRELAVLDLERPRTEVHAIVLSGGSAFGLAVADGVMAWLEERKIGFAAGEAVIPIVPAAVILDRSASLPASRPNAASGRAACEAAREGVVEHGRVGAGAGGTVGKWAGLDYFSPGGLGVASAELDGHRVSALVVVNAVGDVLDENGEVRAGTRSPSPQFAFPPRGNTVLAVVSTSAALDKRQVHFLAARGSDGIARAIYPAHTQYDGDVTFAAASPGGRANVDILGALATEAVAAAIRAAV